MFIVVTEQELSQILYSPLSVETEDSIPLSEEGKMDHLKFL